MRTALFCVITQRVVVILPTFRDNLSVPSSGIKDCSRRWYRQVVPEVGKELQPLSALTTQKSAAPNYFVAEAWKHAFSSLVNILDHAWLAMKSRVQNQCTGSRCLQPYCD